MPGYMSFARLIKWHEKISLVEISDLTGGNVASRIFPVKIHDLDNEDKTLLENE